MDYNQENFDGLKSYLIPHVTEDYGARKIKPVIPSNKVVKRMVEENYRAKLISQIVGAAEPYPARDFAASFHSATRHIHPPQFVTSHKICPESRNPKTIPTYPSTVRSLRWNPCVEMSSAENSLTEMVEETTKFNCMCDSCSNKNCPSKVSSVSALKTPVFKDNIMTFSDRFTMTPRLNDACCGACTPISAAPKVSDGCVSPDIAVKDTETVTYLPRTYISRGCTPIPVQKWTDFIRSECHATGHVPFEIHQEAVRDTDVVDDYCEPIKPKSLRNFFKCKKKPDTDSPQSVPEYGRKIIYNEGISDSIYNRIPKTQIPSPINVVRENSGASVRSKTRSYVEKDDGIPYAHRSNSRYHNSCTKPNSGPLHHYSADDEYRHLVASPKIIRKTVVDRVVKPDVAPLISLPRKVLTSEADIESYIEKEKKDFYINKPMSAYQKKGKK